MFQRAAGTLEIRDCVEQKSLFEGEVKRNEDGTIAAKPFYQYYDRLGNLQMELYLNEEKG